MSIKYKIFASFAFFMLFQTCGVFAQVENTASEVVFEIRDKTGQKRAIVKGTQADMNQDGFIVIHDADSDILETSYGATNFTSKKCVYNRAQNLLKSQTDVTIKNERMDIAGKGMTWIPDQEYLCIDKDVKVIIKAAQLFSK